MFPSPPASLFETVRGILSTTETLPGQKQLAFCMPHMPGTNCNVFVRAIPFALGLFPFVMCGVVWQRGTHNNLYVVNVCATVWL